MRERRASGIWLSLKKLRPDKARAVVRARHGGEDMTTGVMGQSCDVFPPPLAEVGPEA